MNTSALRKRIESEYRARGYCLGWRLLYSPAKVLDGARVAFIGLNPGGSKPAPDHAEFAMASGSAYEREVWKDSTLPGEAPLQLQVRELFRLLGERAEDVLAGNLVPFRSPSWDALPRQKREWAIEFGTDIWGDLLKRSGPEVVITIGNVATKALIPVLDVRDMKRIPVNWGKVKGWRGQIPGGTHVGLPHLSWYRIMGRPESEKAVKRLLGGLTAP
ncbi:MAG: hypothetical protein O7F75_08250 [Alphaproteobacteria bacterium]|nr:hypothetical protein [Alphaproteobacteria bacterium]